jgi:hypothetical protein
MRIEVDVSNRSVAARGRWLRMICAFNLRIYFQRVSGEMEDGVLGGRGRLEESVRCEGGWLWVGVFFEMEQHGGKGLNEEDDADWLESGLSG